MAATVEGGRERLATLFGSAPLGGIAPVVAGVLVPAVMPVGRPVAAIVAAALALPTHPLNGIVRICAVIVAPAASVGIATASLPTTTFVASVPAAPVLPVEPVEPVAPAVAFDQLRV